MLPRSNGPPRGRVGAKGSQPQSVALMRFVALVGVLVACLHAGVWAVSRDITSAPGFDGQLASVSYTPFDGSTRAGMGKGGCRPACAGAGEGGLIAVGGVIGNAIAAALRSMSVEPRDLPLSPSNIWRLIQQVKPMSSNPKTTVQQQ